MGNQKSLYKTYFNEVYLKRDRPKKLELQRSQTGTCENPHGFGTQTHSSSGSNCHTPDCVTQQLGNPGSSSVIAKGQMILTGRATADLIANPARVFGSQRPAKTFKIVIDETHSLTIHVPERIASMIADDELPLNSSHEDWLPTCGWLMEQVQIKYAQLIKQMKSRGSGTKAQFKKKLIVALKTADKNESIDFWLTQY